MDDFSWRPDANCYYSQCKECLREKNAEKNRRWRRNNPKAARRATARWIASNPRAQEMRRAQRAVFRALRSGRIARPEICQDCEVESPLHAHHPDYSKPLDVEWLCEACHLARHGKVLR